MAGSSPSAYGSHRSPVSTIPIDRSQITMLEEGNVIHEPSRNALTEILGVAATPLDAGLDRLADALPEQFSKKGSAISSASGSAWKTHPGRRAKPPLTTNYR